MGSANEFDSVNKLSSGMAMHYYISPLSKPLCTLEQIIDNSSINGMTEKFAVGTYDIRRTKIKFEYA